jgi:hypothetical protein
VGEDSVRVTNAGYALEAIGQLYRDRADRENGFDGLKNQWDRGGYPPAWFRLSDRFVYLLIIHEA